MHPERIKDICTRFRNQEKKKNESEPSDGARGKVRGATTSIHSSGSVNVVAKLCVNAFSNFNKKS